MASGGGAKKKAAKTKKRKRRKGFKTTSSTATAAATLQPQNHLLPSTTTTTSHDHISNLLPNLITAVSSTHSFLLSQDLHLLPSQSLSLESLLSSTSLSLSKLISFASIAPPSFNPPPPSISPHCWFHRFLSFSSDDNDTRWVESFNISKSSFSLLLQLLSPHLSCLSPIPPDYALAATLFRLAHSASYSALSRRFNIDSSTTACRVFYTVCKAITDNAGHLFEFMSDISRIVVGFGWISLPNCCGVLGYDRFELDGDFLGENGFCTVQALVDSEGRFLDVSAGWPSTVKPDDILRQSKLFAGVEESKEYLNGPSFELSDGKLIPQYVLGEACLPNLHWVLTPYKKCDDLHELNSSELAFNAVHSGAIDMVRTAFGRLRTKWKLLSVKWKEQCIEAFPLVIVTCCLLHNFLIKCSEASDDEKFECSRDQEFPMFEGEETEEGKAIREALASHLNRINQRTWDS